MVKTSQNPNVSTASLSGTLAHGYRQMFIFCLAILIACFIVGFRAGGIAGLLIEAVTIAQGVVVCMLIFMQTE